jgi:hypothetical protein
MLSVRTEQLQVFARFSRARFEEDMVRHSKNFSPQLCEVIGDDQLRLAVQSAIARAQTYGFTNRGPLRLFVELMFLFGSAFDTDPQYAFMNARLNAPGDQMERAEDIHQICNNYHDKVAGEANVNVWNALRRLPMLVHEPLTFTNGFVAGMLQEVEHVFPQKAAYIGEAALTALIDEAIATGRKFQFSSMRQGALLVALMFAFGHGCTDDPLYPWIGRTLNDERISEPSARAERLEKKALTWLEHVLASSARGTQA